MNRSILTLRNASLLAPWSNPPRGGQWALRAYSTGLAALLAITTAAPRGVAQERPSDTPERRTPPGAPRAGAQATTPADKIAELFGDPVVAKGTGVLVKRSELDAAAMGLKASATARGQKFTPQESMMFERQVLDRLIQIQLLLAKATDPDRAKARETSDKRFDVILGRSGSEENLVRQLKSMGMTVEELQRKMSDEAIAETVIARELKVEPTDADAKKYYDEFPARFEQPEMVRASHILVSTMDPETKAPLADERKLAKRKLAEDLLQRARAGEDFAKLAKDFSEDPGSRDTGGEYKFPRGQMVRVGGRGRRRRSRHGVNDVNA